MTGLKRRQLLATISTTTAVAVAGCTDLLEDDSAPADDESGNGDDTEPTTDDEPTDENGTDANGDEDDSEDEAESEPETSEELATEFTEELGAARFEAASEMTTTAMGNPIAPGTLEQFWMGYTAVHGEFEEILETDEPDTIDPVQRQQFGDAAVVDLTVAFERGTDELRVPVDDEDVSNAVYNSEYERPDYVDRRSFTETDVTIDADGCRMDGILTVPTEATTGSDDVPGVVIVHGSNPSDKNAESFGTQMYTDLAEGLASQGVAALRYDKRNFACAVAPEDNTLDHVTVDDALVVIDELRDAEGVDPDRIVVVGHSMGGMAAPRIAERDGSLAGAVALAAPARPMSELPVDQYEHLATVGDHDWPQMDAAFEQAQIETQRLRDGTYDADEWIFQHAGGLWQSLAAYDHVEQARTIDDPLFFLQGSRDYQVTLEDDFELWQAELEDRPATTFESYDGLDHRFMSGQGPSVEGEYMVRNNVEPVVIDDLVDWIREL